MFLKRGDIRHCRPAPPRPMSASLLPLRVTVLDPASMQCTAGKGGPALAMLITQRARARSLFLCCWAREPCSPVLVINSIINHHHHQPPPRSTPPRGEGGLDFTPCPRHQHQHPASASHLYPPGPPPELDCTPCQLTRRSARCIGFRMLFLGVFFWAHQARGLCWRLRGEGRRADRRA